jgi:hypothetical protein
VSADRGEPSSRATTEVESSTSATDAETAREEAVAVPLRRRSDTDSEAAGDFEWCEPTADVEHGTDAASAGTDAGESSDGGFEWCEPTADPERGTDSSDVGADPTDPGTNGGPGGDRLTLPPDLVTTRRGPGVDDEAVALLAALRREPDGGRWRRASAAFGVDPDGE